MPWLAFLLFFPCFAVLGGLFLWVSRRLRGALGHFEAAILILAGSCAIAAMQWGFDDADPQYGDIWPQLLSALLGYGAFLVVLGVAAFMRLRKGSAAHSK